MADALKILKKWINDPAQFVRDNFKVEPDEWQKDFLNSVRDNTRTAAKACKGPGKTCVEAWCAWWFLATRVEAKIVATSISGDNLRDGLWAEMAKWQHKSEFLKNKFTWTKTRIYCNEMPENWFMSARQWSKSADSSSQADTLAGLHASKIMFIIDEAGGVPDAVMAAAEAALSTGEECKLLICGNPTQNSGPLYRACTKEKSLWNVIEITGDPDDPKRSPRINIDWAREQIQKYGREHPWVMVNVLGKFPPTAFNALIGPDEMNEAIGRYVELTAYQHSPRVLGVDVARQGDDKTVIAPRQGIAAFKPLALRIPNVIDIAGRVAQAIEKFKPQSVFIDATGGMGYGVIDALRNNFGYSNIVDVQFSGKALNASYFNKRAEMACEFIKWIKEGGCLPDIPELVEEATAQKYFFKGDRLILEDKDLIKQDIGRSPDYFDAYALTFAYPAHNPELDWLKPITAQTKTNGDYNPLGSYIPAQSNKTIADYHPLI